MILPLLAVAAAIDTSPAAARATVERYYAAIDAKRYRAAYLLWSDHGRASGKTYAQFAAGFSQTAHSRVVAGTPYDEEGAAGSTFITVPVQVYATLRNGVRQHFAGTYVLRHVNGVPGATPDELRWSLFQAQLRAVK